MTKIKIVFLGSGSSIPTPERNHPGIFLDYEGDTMLWDCGEGTQRQMMIAGLKPTKIKKIFITHWHADHFAGLMGLIETLHLEERKKPLTVYGPEATRFIDALSEMSYWDFGFELKAVDVNFEKDEVSKLFENKFYKILSIPVRHSIPAVAYCLEEKDRWNIDMEKAQNYGLKEGPVLEELKENGCVKVNGRVVYLKDVAHKTPGKKIVYSGDTAPCKNVVSLAKGADLLIHDGTFIGGPEEIKRNHLKERHTSVTDAAKLAKEAKVKKLILTHFSRRYKNVSKLIEEARKIFPNTDGAKDFLEVIL